MPHLDEMYGDGSDAYPSDLPELETEEKPQMSKKPCPRLIGKEIVLSPRDRAWICNGNRDKARKNEESENYRVILVDEDGELASDPLAKFVIENKVGENALKEPVWAKADITIEIAMSLIYYAMVIEGYRG